MPHGLALIESLDLLCIADREHMRVVCPRAGLVPNSGTQPVSIQTPDLGRVFGVAASGAYLNGTHTSALRMYGDLLPSSTRLSFITQYGLYMCLYMSVQQHDLLP
jgi:hypothetical protein